MRERSNEGKGTYLIEIENGNGCFCTDNTDKGVCVCMYVFLLAGSSQHIATHSAFVAVLPVANVSEVRTLNLYGKSTN